MRKVFFILAFVGVLTGCKSVKTEVEQFETNKEIVQKTFPNYHVTSFRQFNYVFQVSNPEYVIKVTLEKQKIVKTDTLRVFTKTASIQ
jgi:hypothetical protein